MGRLGLGHWLGEWAPSEDSLPSIFSMWLSASGSQDGYHTSRYGIRVPGKRRVEAVYWPRLLLFIGKQWL